MFGKPLLALSALALAVSALPERTELGVYVGDFRNYIHDVEGEVYVVDRKTIFIKGFGYDGAGPDAYFCASRGRRRSLRGCTVIPYSPDGIPFVDGEEVILGFSKGRDVTLELPEGLEATDINKLSVWCRRFRSNFGDIKFPEGIDKLLDEE